MDGSKSNGLQINDSSYYYEIKHHNGFNIKGQKQHFQVIKLSKSRLHRLNQIKEQVLLIEAEIEKTTGSAKGRCRSAANKIKKFLENSSLLDSVVENFL